MRMTIQTLLYTALVTTIFACGGGEGDDDECSGDDDCAVREVCESGACVVPGAESDAESDGADESDADLRDVPVDVLADTAADIGDDSTPQPDAATDTGEEDSVAPDGESDAASDGESDGSGEADAGPDVDEDVYTGPITLTTEITSPDRNDTFQVNYVINATGVVSDSVFAPEELTVRWRTAQTGDLATSTPDAEGNVTARIRLPDAGTYLIEMIAETPEGQTASTTVQVGICDFSTPETFDPDLLSDDWRIYGDAQWTEEGWLEMTGIETGRSGAIYFVGSTVDPGDIGFEFSIYTGGGAGSGADGFAMSVFNAANVEQLSEWVNAAGSGGCMSYGLVGDCGVYEDIEAFHIEFDTWYNTLGDDSGVQDPTENDHVAIALDGNPADHVAWADVGDIEDSEWHTVRVDIEGARVRVWLDGAQIIDEVVTGFTFKGGYLGFSGSTGLYTNFHRFDNLTILEECVID
jgi:hypothetical protein